MLRIQERLPASWGEQLAAITATYERALPRCVGYKLAGDDKVPSKPDRDR